MPDSSGPADTVMMGIMHDALRRDLTRARAVLVADTVLPDSQRVALSNHVLFMLDFLHAHHSSEDAKLWPTVRELDPGAAGLLDAMSHDHERIAAETDQLAEAARQYADTGGEAHRATLVSALDRLNGCLIPHLDREEAEVLPRISACMTHAQWQAFEKSAMPPFSKRVLAEYFNWFLEDLDTPRRDKAMASLPAPIVFLLTRVYGPGYRRRAAVRWAPFRPATAQTRSSVKEA